MMHECDRERVVCVSSGIKSNVFRFSFTICFTEDDKLLPDKQSIRVEQTRRQSSTVKSGGKKLKRVINLTSVDGKRQDAAEVQRASFSYPLFSCIMAEEHSSEVTRGN